MKELVNRVPFFVLLFLTTLFSVAGSAQGPAKSPLRYFRGAPDMQVQAPNPSGSDPETRGCRIRLFSQRSTNMKSLEWTQRTAIRISTILFSTSSAILPFQTRSTWSPWSAAIRYTSAPLTDTLRGADVPLSEARQVWRNTTQPMCGMSGFYEELFPLVRRINQTLPPEKKLSRAGVRPSR